MKMMLEKEKIKLVVEENEIGEWFLEKYQQRKELEIKIKEEFDLRDYSTLDIIGKGISYFFHILFVTIIIDSIIGWISNSSTLMTCGLGIGFFIFICSIMDLIKQKPKFYEVMKKLSHIQGELNSLDEEDNIEILKFLLPHVKNEKIATKFDNLIILISHENINDKFFTQLDNFFALVEEHERLCMEEKEIKEHQQKINHIKNRLGMDVENKVEESIEQDLTSILQDKYRALL